MTNLSALVKADADEEIKNKSRPKNKFNYQANRTFIIGRIRTLFIKLVVGISEMSDLDILLDDATCFLFYNKQLSDSISATFPRKFTLTVSGTVSLIPKLFFLVPPACSCMFFLCYYKSISESW